MKKRLLFGLVAVLVLFLGAWFGLQAWIESAGGKAAVERQLSASSGQRVMLQGAFDVSFLPVPGVRGTDLRVYDPVSGKEFAGSRSYSVDFELRPLFEKRIVVERLHVDWMRFRVAGERQVAIPSIELTGFEPGRETAVSVGLGPFGTVDGNFTWYPERSRLDVSLVWNGPEREPVGLDGRFSYRADGADFDGLRISVAEQAVEGSGCFFAVPAPRLDVELKAGRLDLDRIQRALDFGAGGGAGMPFELNARLRADELVRGGVVAKGIVLEYGSGPSCP